MNNRQKEEGPLPPISTLLELPPWRSILPPTHTTFFPATSQPSTLNGFTFEQVKAVIKDKKTRSIKDAAKTLGSNSTKLGGFLFRFKTTYTNIKLGDLTDEEIIVAFNKDSSLKTAGDKLGVAGYNLSKYLTEERSYLDAYLYNCNKPAV